MRIAILRPAEYLIETEKLLSDAGFEVIGVPFLKIERIGIELDEFHFQYAIITSQTAARIILDEAELLNRIKKAEVISIGPKTAKTLEKAGIKSLTPSKFDSESLYTEFKSRLKGKKVAIFRSDKGDPILLKLAEIADLKEYVLYKIEYEHGLEQRKFLKTLIDDPLDCIIFSSRMMVRSFFELAKKLGLKDELKEMMKDMVVIAIGPPTWAELDRYGIEALTPKEYTFTGVLELLKGIDQR